MVLGLLKPEDWQRLHGAVRSLVDSAPEFPTGQTELSPSDLIWIGRLRAILGEIGQITAPSRLDRAVSSLRNLRLREEGRSIVFELLFQAFAETELRSPNFESGFIPVGSKFDALAAIARIVERAASNVMFLDPYANHELLQSYCILAKEGVEIRILADKKSAKPDIIPAAEAWAKQYGKARPMSLRLAPERTLHDRAILVDQRLAVVVTQSFKDIAERSPASLTSLPEEAAKLKIAYYDEVWATSEVII